MADRYLTGYFVAARAVPKTEAEPVTPRAKNSGTYRREQIDMKI